jgi:Arc/MetJ-type ribon-helix-helix transcriptional regulator
MSKQHGGRRPGAGRKLASPEGKATAIGVSVPQTLVERLDALAETKGWNRSEAVTRAIRGLLARHRALRREGESNPIRARDSLGSLIRRLRRQDAGRSPIRHGVFWRTSRLANQKR